MDRMLSMNLREMNCFVELPSIRNREVLGIYRLWWDGFAKAGIPFTCHWGKLHGMNAARLDEGVATADWRAA